METIERKKPRPPPVFHAGVQGEIVERAVLVTGRSGRGPGLRSDRDGGAGPGRSGEDRTPGSGRADQRGANCPDFVGETVIAATAPAFRTTASHTIFLADSPTGGLTQGSSEVLPAQLEPDGATMLVTAVAPSVGDQLH